MRKERPVVVVTYVVTPTSQDAQFKDASMGRRRCIQSYRCFTGCSELTVNLVRVLDAFEMRGLCPMP